MIPHYTLFRGVCGKAVSAPAKALVVRGEVVRLAKSYASAHGTSVSSLVESYLKNLTAAEGNDRSSDPDSWPPTTRSLYGALPDIGGVDTDQLKRRYLNNKYLHD